MSAPPAVAVAVAPAARLHPAHFEPARVPDAVLRFGTATGAGGLPVGSPGKVGLLELGFELRGPAGRQRTELVHHYQKSPLQIMRPLYYDEARPDLPYTFLMTTGGGVLHGDRQRIDLTFGAGSSAHVTTQAHTRLYRMEHGYATAILDLQVGPGAYVEYLPDPVIPFAQSRFYQHAHVRLDEAGTLVYGETVYAGRLSRGERHEYDAYASDLEIDRGAARPLVVDRIRLAPGGAGVGGRAVLDGFDIVSTLYVLTPTVAAAEVADRVDAALRETAGDHRFGVSVLPGDAGAWARILGDDPVALRAATTATWGAVRRLLTGLPAPLIRKS